MLEQNAKPTIGAQSVVGNPSQVSQLGLQVEDIMVPIFGIKVAEDKTGRVLGPIFVVILGEGQSRVCSEDQADAVHLQFGVVWCWSFSQRYGSRGGCRVSQQCCGT